MEFQKLDLKGACLIKPQVFKDERGFFLETYSRGEFEKNGIDVSFVQDNYSKSVCRGVIRGLHFQRNPNAQAKLVRVVRGSVYDVIVDLRKDSSTFGQWRGFDLSEKNLLMLFVPRGFAHGFCTKEDDTEFEYKCDGLYAPESESGIIWDDPTLNINWPITGPVLSDKDKRLQTFEDFIKNNSF